MTRVDRRAMLKSTLAIGYAALPHHGVFGSIRNGVDVPVRVITRGPKHHWFAYYDKLEFDPSMRYVLGMEVDCEHRSPRPDDVIKMGMVDLQDNDRNQSVYLYHIPTGRKIVLGHFPSPREYSGEWRCDAHPRHSPDGQMIVIDAPQRGQGRQLHLLDVSNIIG